jgi:D-alanyl-D-alanine carboxypeptidase
MPSARKSVRRSTHRLQGLARALGIPKNYARARHLRPQPEARTLVSVGPAPDDGQLVRLAPPAAAAWRRMRAAAADDGVVLLPLSGFRSVARQTALIRAKLAAGQPIEKILELAAAPGFSEHHTGRALDLGSPEQVKLDEEFGRTAAFRWMRRHAGEFGFHLSYPRDNRHGIAYEPWHWCWRLARREAR